MLQTSSSFDPQLSGAEVAVSFAEVISAMTFALDLTEGAAPGHALRSCLLGMRMADALHLPLHQRTDLYYALQLKDVGCSSNASRMTQIIGGDDRAMKASVKLEDWRKNSISLRGLKTLWRNILPGKSVPRRVLRFLDIARHAHSNRIEMIQLRCDRGAQIVRRLELDETTASAVRSLDEHWDGMGYPEGLKGEQIPLLSRICSVAQNLEVFAIEDSVESAMKVLRKRSGIWFDPKLVRLAEKLNADTNFWLHCRRGDPVEETRHAVLALDPGIRAVLTEERIDHICEAFAGVVDAKSHFTFRHSIGVAEVAVEIALELGLPPDRVQLVRRAALLHDIGKLGVPNPILDKEGKLTTEEWATVIEHPRMTHSILNRISAFRELAAIAAEHHEKLDGSGYPQGLRGAQMSMEARVLAVADMFAAMAENRPYRLGMEPSKILNILRPDVPHKLDPHCFRALEQVVEDWNWLSAADLTMEVGRFARFHPRSLRVNEELTQLI